MSDNFQDQLIARISADTLKSISRRISAVSTTGSDYLSLTFNASENTLHVYFDNGFTIFSCNFAFDVEANLKCVVNAAIFANVCKYFVNYADIYVDGGLLEFRFGETRSGINIAQHHCSENYDLQSLNCTDFFKITSDELSYLIDSIVFAASGDDAYSYLKCIYFDCTENLKIVATDGKRLACRECDITFNDTKYSVLITKRSALSLLRLLKDDKSEIQVLQADGFLIFTNDALNIMIRTVKAAYPDYNALLNKSFQHSIKLNRVLLLDKISAISSVMKDDLGVKITFYTSKINFYSYGGNNSWFTDSIEGEFDVEDELYFACNARYLKEAINNISDDEVNININDQCSPILIRGNDALYNVLIMPIIWQSQNKD